MSLVGEHGRCTWKDILSDQIFTNDHDHHSRRSDIFLDSAVNDSVFTYVNRLGKEAGGNICHQSFALCIGKSFKFCSVNGIVFADVHIIGIRTDIQITAVRNIGKGLILRRCDLIDLAVLLRFLISFFGPLSGDNIICHPVFHQVHGNHCKLL